MFFKKIIKNKTFKQDTIISFDKILKKKLLNFSFFNKIIFRNSSSDLFILDNHINYFFRENFLSKKDLIKNGFCLNSKYMLYYHKFDKNIRFILPTIFKSEVSLIVKNFESNLKLLLNKGIKNLKVISLKIKGGVVGYSLGFIGFFSLKNAFRSFEFLNSIEKVRKPTFHFVLNYKSIKFRFFFNSISNYKNIKFRKNFINNNTYFFILLYL